jgi:helicase MOV-10
MSKGGRWLARSGRDREDRNDLLVERLVATGLDSAKLYRLDAPSTYEEDMFDNVQAFSQIPGHERLLAFNVVLSTCFKGGFLRDLNVPAGHFSHIVIDEASQAEEPLAMIPIMTFSNSYINCHPVRVGKELL